MTEQYLITFDEFNKLVDYLLKDNFLYGNEKKNRFAVDPVDVQGKQEKPYPFSQIFTYNFNRTNSASKFLQKYYSKQLQEGGLKDEKMVAIGHSCDGRALIELAKRHQLNRENLFYINMEDIGIIPSKVILKLLKDEGIDPASVTEEFQTPDKIMFKLNDGTVKEFEFGDKISIHENCLRCYRKKMEDNFDLSVSWISLEPFSHQLIVKVGSEEGSTVLKESKIKLSKLKSDQIESMEQVQSAIIEKAKIKRDADIKAFREDLDRINAIGDCNMCGICINSCPVCFCVSCVLQKQRKEKTIDNLSYQLTRISHVGDSCVGCGKCDQNCPKNLPLSLYFQSTNDFVGKEFGYVSGSGTDPMPRSRDSVKNES